MGQSARPHRHARQGERRLRAFVRRYGWRAYALPVLTALTIVALVHTGPSSRTRAAADPATNQSTSVAAKARTAVRVEGRQADVANYAPAVTPSPITVSLGDDAASCAGNTYPQLVVVSIKHQHLWACQGQKEVNSTAVTTGETDNGDQTPLGSWRVQAKQRDRYLVGPGYRDYVKYWVPFNGDFGFHDASWQTMPFGSQNYTANGSHGCVHLPTPTMAWLYQWVAVNQTVVTIEA